MSDRPEIDLNVKLEDALKQMDSLVKKFDALDKKAKTAKAPMDELDKKFAKLDKTTGTLNKNWDNLDVSFKNFFSGTLPTGKQALDLFFTSLLAIGIAAAGITFKVFKDGIEQSKKAEEAQAKLAQALKSTGSYSREAAEEFENLADALQAKSRFNAEEIIASVAIAKNYGASNEQAKKLVAASVELAARTGGDLNSAATRLGQTLLGNMSKLDKTDKMFKDLTKSQLASGAAIDLINKNWTGSSAAGMDTYAGKLKILQDSWGNFTRRLGEWWTQSKGVRGLIDDLTKTLSFLGQELQKYNAQTGLVVRTQADFKLRIQGIKDEIQSLNIEQDYNKKIMESQPSTLRKLLGATDSHTESVKKSTDEYNKNVIAIQKLQAEQENLEKNLAKAPVKVSDDGGGTTNTGGQLQEQLQANAAKLEAQAQFQAAQSDFYAQTAAQKLATDEAQRAAELEAEFNHQQQLLQIARDAGLAKNAEEERQTGDANLRRTKDQTEQLKFATQMTKLNTDTQKKRVQMQKDLDKKREEDQKATFGTIATMANSNNKTLAALGKAAGIAQIAIETPVAIAKALSAFPPPFNFVAAGLVGAAMAVQASQIAGLNFADGGVMPDQNGRIPGSAFMGDRLQANINAGETVLNQRETRVVGSVMQQGFTFGGTLALDVLMQIRDNVARPAVFALNGTVLNEEMNRYNNLRLV